MKRDYYSNTISSFLKETPDEILGSLARMSDFDLGQEQRDAWVAEIEILRKVLQPFSGKLYFEYSIPRMGKRIDVLLLIDNVIFVLEFKIGSNGFFSQDIDQVMDYALDLKYFHTESTSHLIAPILIATKSDQTMSTIAMTQHGDNVIFPINCNDVSLQEVIKDVLIFAEGSTIDPNKWETGSYCPTPTIIEAAMALYRGHSVENIARNDAGAINLTKTSAAISEIIEMSQVKSHKSICFVTGVPGAGKTLVGLNIANKHIDKDSKLYSVFLSGNEPLVRILREALTRDKVKIEKESGIKITKKEVMRSVKSFIQNVHNFRDECLQDPKPPVEHVAIFDEAQRAWNLLQTTKFMKQKKNRPNFSQSEPEYLISCLDRHPTWAVIVCLVGGGQEIHTGEAGISEWIESIKRSFPKWNIYLSSQLTEKEFSIGTLLDGDLNKANIFKRDDLHLSVSMRSFRSENVSKLVKCILDIDIQSAKNILEEVNKKYPIVITRDLYKAKKWLRDHARGSERYGMMVSSQAERLKPQAIYVKSPVDPIHWFLDEKNDIRSSYYLEDVVTEFDIQGLELDWSCVVWDADFRYTKDGWDHNSFVGNKWNKIHKSDRKVYLKNAYRVLLTRARQGTVIVIPQGDTADPTRDPDYYDPTFNYLHDIGFSVI